MPSLRPLWWAVLAVTLLLVAGVGPIHAADQMIGVAKPADLMIPAKRVPAGYLFQLSNSHPLTDATLTPMLGLHMLTLFHQSGMVAGYHGWLDADTNDGAPFVTYDLYAFNSIKGSRFARLAYQDLVLGVQLPNQDPALPKSATVWTDGTGVYGPNNQPYAVAEIVFRVANVVGDITAFYAGAGSPALGAALREASVVTEACVSWLSTLLPSTHQSLTTPLLPLAALPAAMRRTRRGRRRG